MLNELADTTALQVKAVLLSVNQQVVSRTRTFSFVVERERERERERETERDRERMREILYGGRVSKSLAIKD